MRKFIILVTLIIFPGIHRSAAQAYPSKTDSTAIVFIYKVTLQCGRQQNSADFALKNAKTKDVSAFAAQMSGDFKKLNAKLAALVKASNYQVPAHIEESVAPEQTLTNDADDNFDQKYVKQSLKDLNGLIILLEGTPAGGSYRALQQFVAEALPVVRGDEQEAYRLYQKYNPKK